MALIRCYECGNSVSDSAETCPHCGYDIAYATARKKEKEARQRHEIERKKELERLRNGLCPMCGASSAYIKKVKVTHNVEDRFGYGTYDFVYVTKSFERDECSVCGNIIFDEKNFL
jgi:ribosomal protein S27AE